MIERAETKTLDPDLASAVADWIIVFMSERRGHGVDAYGANGKKMDNSWVLDDLITELHQKCPDVVGRMLQAGAAAFIKETEPCEDCGGRGRVLLGGKQIFCGNCKGKGRQLVLDNALEG